MLTDSKLVLIKLLLACATSLKLFNYLKKKRKMIIKERMKSKSKFIIMHENLKGIYCEYYEGFFDSSQSNWIKAG